MFKIFTGYDNNLILRHVKPSHGAVRVLASSIREFIGIEIGLELSILKNPKKIRPALQKIHFYKIFNLKKSKKNSPCVTKNQFL